MFVKAGIVVAAAAASLLAVSPLAFAGEYGGDHDSHKGHHKSHKSHDSDDNDGDHRSKGNRHRGDDGDCNGNGNVNQVNSGDSKGLINISHVNAAVPINVCDNDVLSGVLGILSSDLSNSSND
jgi:hypothetical protein